MVNCIQKNTAAEEEIRTPRTGTVANSEPVFYEVIPIIQKKLLSKYGVTFIFPYYFGLVFYKND